MEKRKVAELIFREYSGGDPSDESGLEIIDFEYAVDSARAYKILDDYRKGIRLDGERYINEAWLKTYDSVPVLLNEISDTYYSVLPEKVLGLPKGNGLYFVSRQKDISKPFSPFTTADVFILSSVLNLKNDENIFYRQDSENIYYIDFDSTIKNVFVQLVPLSSDDIPDEFVHEIKELVLNQYLKPKQVGVVEDKLTNGNPNKVEIK